MEENKTFTTVDSLNESANKTYNELIANGQIKDLLKTMGNFVRETVDNDLLILNQMPTATKLYTKEEWEKAKDRQLIESPKYIHLVGLTLYKNEQGPIDNKGSLHVIGTNKLHAHVRTLYDISQTTGLEPLPEIDKENLAGHFDTVKNSLERTSKGYTVKYDDIKENSTIDKDNKLIVIKNGLSLGEVISELIDQTTKVLIDCRRPEGLTKSEVANINELEHSAAVYAIHSRYGLELPNYDFSQIQKLSEENKEKFKENLGKVRSVVYQLTHNLENAIEFETRGLNKAKTSNYQGYKQDSNSNQNTSQNQNDGEVM